jgi:hypothetical protein
VNQRTFQADNPFHQLRKSYRTFGLALILLPLLLGLSGVIWGLGQNPLAILTVLIGIFGPVLLTRKAYTAFHRFRLQHSISIPVPLSLIHPLPNLVEPASEIQSQNEAEIELLDEMPIPQIPLTPNTTVAILQNTIGVTDKHNLIILGNLDTEDKGESE